MQITTPNPLHYQTASMLILSFRFTGTRKVVASRLMGSLDFKAELEAFVPILERLYGHYRVSAVEIISYQRGGFFYDPWPDGLSLVQSYQAQRDQPPGTPSWPGTKRPEPGEPTGSVMRTPA